jgi:hypothetical protein
MPPVWRRPMRRQTSAVFVFSGAGRNAMTSKPAVTSVILPRNLGAKRFRFAALRFGVCL